jgi:hypothetical protein
MRTTRPYAINEQRPSQPFSASWKPNSTEPGRYKQYQIVGTQHFYDTDAV